MSIFGARSIGRIPRWFLFTIVLVIQCALLVQNQFVVKQVCASELQTSLILQNAPNGVLNPRLGCEVTSPPIVVKEVFASASQIPHIKENTLDSNLDTRWSADGNEQWIYYDLGEVKSLDHVEIAFYRGDERRYRFRLIVSDDASTWRTVRESDLSSGTTLNLEAFEFDVENVRARYIGYVGEGNTSGDGNNSLTEVRIYRDEAQPPPLAVKQVRASAFQDPQIPRNTLDDDLNTQWSADGIGQWIEYDLGERRNISHVGIVFNKGDQLTARFHLQAYDDPNDTSTWVTVLVNGQSSGTDRDLEIFDFVDVQKRYLRYVGEGNSLDNGNNLIEVRIYGGKISPTPFTIEDVKASSSDGGMNPQNTLDDKLNTHWLAKGLNQWIYYDLGSQGNQIIDRVEIAFYRGNERKYRFQLEVSDDANTWKAVLKNVQSSGTTLDAETFDFADVKARYVRFLGQGNDSDSDHQENALTEVRVLPGKLLPNLVISSGTPSVDQNTVAPGDALKLSPWTVENCGGVTAGGFEYGFYLSPDALIETNDILLDGETASELIPGASFSSPSVELEIPASTAPGTYDLGILVDRTNTVDESSEWNNYTSANITVQLPQKPDLITTSVSAPDSANAGAKISVSATVNNQGERSAGAFRVGFYLSTDSRISTSDRLLGYRSVDSLSAGASDRVNRSVTIPGDLESDRYYIGAYADYQKKVSETSESNNTRARSIQIDERKKADLVITRLSAPSSANAGERIAVSAVIENQGKRSAGAFRVGFYLSKDSKISTADRLLDYMSAESLPAGAGRGARPTLTIPSDVESGRYYIGAYADYQRKVTEESESNNTRARSIQIASAKPDLVITHLSAPSTVVRRRSYPISVVVTNRGNRPAGAFSLGIYLSTNSRIETTDRRLYGVSYRGPLPAGASREIDRRIPVPPNVKGRYYLGVYADYRRQVTETIESNNTRAQPILIR